MKWNKLVWEKLKVKVLSCYFPINLNWFSNFNTVASMNLHRAKLLWNLETNISDFTEATQTTDVGGVGKIALNFVNSICTLPKIKILESCTKEYTYCVLINMYYVTNSCLKFFHAIYTTSATVLTICSFQNFKFLSRKKMHGQS